MGKLIRVSPAVLLMLTACGSRGTHHDDDEPVIITPPPACQGDDDCGDGAICFEGTCTLLAETEAPDTTPPPTTTSETAPTGTATTDSTTTSLPDPEEPMSLSGVWVGYLEGGQFASGSDVVRLEIDVDDCTPTASITFGEGEPLPPVTNPDVGYPDDIGLEIPWGRWYEGNAYAASNIEISELRLQLDVFNGQIWDEWCQLQEPVEVQDGYYSCVNASGWSYDGEVCTANTPEGPVEHDCGHLALCTYGTCACDASSCQANNGGGAALDVALDDGHLEGTLTGFGPVRLYREE